MRVYHYSTSARLAEILHSGAILPRTRSHRLDPYGVPAAVWFSAAPVWEPACSATVEIGPDGQLPSGIVPGSPFEAVRIAVRDSDTLPWDTALLRRLTHWSVLWRLHHTGADIGSNPDLWCVSLKPVPMSAWLAVEVWDGGRWATLAMDGCAYPGAGMVRMAGAKQTGIEGNNEEGGLREAV